MTVKTMKLEDKARRTIRTELQRLQVAVNEDIQRNADMLDKIRNELSMLLRESNSLKERITKLEQWKREPDIEQNTIKPDPKAHS